MRPAIHIERDGNQLMPQAGSAPGQKLVTELKVSGHLMTLDKGLFCVFHAPGSTAADPQTGLPGVRITHPPMQDKGRIDITSFNEDGWIGAEGSAALIRINEGPSQLLVTIYQNGAGQHEAPKLQVMRLGDVPAGAAVRAPAAATAAASDPVPPEASRPAETEAAAQAPTPVQGAEVAAHVQRRGDKLGKIGEWMGEPGSQSWIEGFAIAPNRHVGSEDIEYQAVLGKGWLSPWSEGGQYCGSRGMALPILKGKATETYSLRITATFTDGTRIGPLADTETAEAESLAPLEAFLIEILPLGAASSPDAEPEASSQEAPVQKDASRNSIKTKSRAAAAEKRSAVGPKASTPVSRTGPKPDPVSAPRAGARPAAKTAGKPASRKPGPPARR